MSPTDSSASSFPPAYSTPTQLNNSATAGLEHPIMSASLGKPRFLFAFLPLVPFSDLSSASSSFAPFAIL